MPVPDDLEFTKRHTLTTVAGFARDFQHWGARYQGVKREMRELARLGADGPLNGLLMELSLAIERGMTPAAASAFIDVLQKIREARPAHRRAINAAIKALEAV